MLRQPSLRSSHPPLSLPLRTDGRTVQIGSDGFLRDERSVRRGGRRERHLQLEGPERSTEEGWRTRQEAVGMIPSHRSSEGVYISYVDSLFRIIGVVYGKWVAVERGTECDLITSLQSTPNGEGNKK